MSTFTGHLMLEKESGMIFACTETINYSQVLVFLLSMSEPFVSPRQVERTGAHIHIGKSTGQLPAV